MKKVRPTFDRPPLVEQAITVAFETLSNFSIGDFGLFWTLIQRDFPHSENQAPVETNIEGEGFRPQQFQLRLLQGSALPRCFYRSNDGSELIQLQPNRFSFNWLGSDDSCYPRSEATMERFHQLFSKFRDFVKDRKLGSINITQCELVNVNIIPIADFGDDFSVAPLIFESAKFGRTVEFLRPESYINNTQYAIMEDGFAGRLYVEINPVTRIEDGAPAYRFEITARGAPIDEPAGIEAFFEYARNSINGAFLANTTKNAQERWGLKNG